MATHNDIGRFGEEKALDYLVSQHFEILETNWRYKKAEIDIIAIKNKKIHCIEVKTRTNTSYGNPEVFVNVKKIKLQLLGINHYVELHDLDFEIQFDILSIILQNKQVNIEHIENAYYYF
nr:YraN family protein [uncultured Flavobacterium sp.]